MRRRRARRRPRHQASRRDIAGRLVILSGPSGVGKSTLAAALLARRPDLSTVTSWTTRPPRPGDGTGKTYEYVRREDFERMRNANEFLEWAEVHGELYGTPRDAVERLLGDGRTVLLEIDVQGAHQVKRRFPAAVTIFVEPPSWEELEARLARRGTEDAAALKTRLETARRELADAGDFTHRVVNDHLERAVDEVNRILGPAPTKG